MDFCSARFFLSLSGVGGLIEIVISEASLAKGSEEKAEHFYVSNFHKINSDDQIISEVVEKDYNSLSDYDQKILLLDHHIGNANTSLLHKSAFDQHGLFNETLDCQPDVELWLRLCLLHDFRVFFIPKFLLQYRVHGGQITQNTSLKQIRKQRKMIQDYFLSQIEKQERERI